jgi:hypothetical protein
MELGTKQGPRFFIGFRPIVCGLLLAQWACYATLTFCVCEKKTVEQKKVSHSDKQYPDNTN